MIQRMFLATGVGGLRDQLQCEQPSVTMPVDMQLGCRCRSNGMGCSLQSKHQRLHIFETRGMSWYFDYFRDLCHNAKIILFLLRQLVLFIFLCKTLCFAINLTLVRAEATRPSAVFSTPVSG
ncbi:hypothetical protein DL95DRAFT_73577 [Leptodontidium sp. 2 PMI_412]|nr:hypothetical protein DL95DRAFT_73577 [Leptodontidium sp. 2 PMI_412]